jgi:hypothetical protein
MRQVLAECGRVVGPRGRVILVVCRSGIRRVAIPTHEIFAEPAEPSRDLTLLANSLWCV